MRRFPLAALLVVSGALVLAAGAAARSSDDHGRSTATSGPFTIVTTDGGSCGQQWAADTIRRTYTVRANGDGTYGLLETDVGSFTTLGPVSPGACQTTQPHGSVVAPGIKGALLGGLTGIVSCAGPCVYSSAGAAACPSTGCTRAVFLAAAFGPTATLATTAFRFDYLSGDPLLQFHHWTDEGTATTEQFAGDIATS